MEANTKCANRRCLCIAKLPSGCCCATCEQASERINAGHEPASRCACAHQRCAAAAAEKVTAESLQLASAAIFEA